MNEKHVAVDLDDVVLDFLGGLIRSVNMEYGSSLTREDIHDWNLHPILDPIIGTPDAPRSFWKWLRQRDWLWANFDAVPGAIGGLERLREQGYYLECLTSKPEWAEHNVWKWLGKWRPPFNRVTIVNGDQIKADYSDALFLVDDKPSNCIEWALTGRIAILFERPHNKEIVMVGTQEGIVLLAKDWTDVVRHIEAHNA